MRRGDLVSVAARKHYSGKPRPALIVQADTFTAAGTESVIVCLLSIRLVDAPLVRLDLEPDTENSLEAPSRIMIDKLTTAPRAGIGHRIRRLDRDDLVRVDRALAVFLGIA